MSPTDQIPQRTESCDALPKITRTSRSAPGRREASRDPRARQAVTFGCFAEDRPAVVAAARAAGVVEPDVLRLGLEIDGAAPQADDVCDLIRLHRVDRRIGVEDAYADEMPESRKSVAVLG